MFHRCFYQNRTDKKINFIRLLSEYSGKESYDCDLSNVKVKDQIDIDKQMFSLKRDLFLKKYM